MTKQQFKDFIITELESFDKQADKWDFDTLELADWLEQFHIYLEI